MIPPGYLILFGIQTTHEMCPLFEEVKKFDPYRWEKLRKEGSNSPKYSFLPFSIGDRSCVGKVFAMDFIKVFIIEMIRWIDWNLINGIPEIRTAPIPFPKDDLPMEINSFDYARYKKLYAERGMNGMSLISS